MDAFRTEQKKDCVDYGKGKHTYGCLCCRKIADLNRFKKLSRRLARTRLKAADRRGKLND